jgi:hypothetical protein
MVKSKINPDKVDYKEDIGVDDEDIGVSSWTYSYTIHNMNIEIALGKEKHTFSNKGITYFHIYLLLAFHWRNTLLGLFLSFDSL